MPKTRSGSAIFVKTAAYSEYLLKFHRGVLRVMREVFFNFHKKKQPVSGRRKVKASAFRKPQGLIFPAVDRRKINFFSKRPEKRL